MKNWSFRIKAYPKKEVLPQALLRPGSMFGLFEYFDFYRKLGEPPAYDVSAGCRSPFIVANFVATGLLGKLKAQSLAISCDCRGNKLRQAIYRTPPIVLRAAEAKLAKRIAGFRRLRRKGVIGLGNIGYRIAAGLAKGNTRLFVYDKDKRALNEFITEFPATVACSNVCDLISHSDLVFGCTGTETLPRSCWSRLGTGHKTLVSCSSGDVEFQALLRSGLGQPKNPADPFSAIDYHFEKVSLTILEGGFPITFDRAPVSAPLKDMQMTRALLFGAIIQAVVCADERKSGGGGLEMLHPGIQRFVVNNWLKLNPARRKDYPPEILAGFQDEAWVREHSEGAYLESPRLSAIFTAPPDDLRSTILFGGSTKTRR